MPIVQHHDRADFGNRPPASLCEALRAGIATTFWVEKFGGRLVDVGLRCGMLVFNLACSRGSKASIFTGLVLVLATALASGQSAQRKPLPTEPMEEYDNPPAPSPLWGIGVSPGMVSVHDQFTSHQVNVNASGLNITGDAANEPAIAVDPTDHNRMVVGWRQFDSVTSNFRQAGWGYTSNGGTTWTFPGVLESGVFRSDPVLGCDDTGRFFYLSLLQSFDVTMWRSLNGGQTFTNIAPAKGGDKQWFVIDNTATSTGHGFQYQFWDNASPFAPFEFSRSTDGGFTWMDPITIPNVPQWGTPDVDSNGNLFFGGVTPSLDQFWCIRSTNAKNGAVIPSFDQSTQVNLGGVIDYFDTINPEGLIGQVFLVADRSGTSTNNNVYMLASVQPTGATTGSDVMFVRSTNGGQTFSAPKRVNDDPINHSKWHWMGTLAVAPNGRIDSVWFDTRNAANNTDSQLFYSYSTDGGDTWSPNVAVSNTFNPFLGYPNQNKMGDYMTIVSDNTGADVAFAATFNLEEDIYYVRVAPGIAPSTPTPTPSPGTPTPTPGTPTPSPASTPTQTPTPTPTPGVTPSPTSTPTPSATPTPTPGVTPPSASQAINLSTRMRVQTGDNVGIGGFIISGSAPKHVLLRALGPSITGISGVLADPVLELHGPGTFATISNDNWRDDPAQEAAILATGLAPANNLEGAIDATLNPGAYTAVVRGKNNTSGLGLVEVYDLSQAVLAKLANISTRAFVSTGDNIVIAGFVLGNHSGNDRIVVRGIGPSLAALGVSNTLADPTLELRDSNGALLMANNDWQEDAAQAAELTAAGLAPTNSFESGIAATLPPGAYTALLAGLNNGAGIGVVEVYDRGL
jgi:hypothetical protein